MGHRRVGLLSGPQHLESARLRRDGFVAARPADIQIAWEVSVPFDGMLTADAVVALRRRAKATLSVAGNDLIAIIFNLANMLLVAAIEIAGLAVVFPVGMMSGPRK